MTGPCICCGKTTTPVDLTVFGDAASELGVPDGTVIASRYSCESCEASAMAERRQLQGQFRRLQLRGYSKAEANRIMERRVDRFFHNGTFVPMSRRAVA